MLSGRGVLHCETPVGPSARTRQYIDAGSPVIHGSATGTEAAGVRVRADQIRALRAAKLRLVESSNW